MKPFKRIALLVIIAGLILGDVKTEAKETIQIPDEIQESCEKYGDE